MSAVEPTSRLYDDLPDLLGTVFRIAARPGSPSTLDLLRIGGGELTPQEIETEAVTLRRIALEASGLLGRRYLLGRYEVASESERFALETLARECVSKYPRMRDPYLVEDLVRDELGKPRKGGFTEHNGKKIQRHSNEWWAEHNGIAVRTIFRYQASVREELARLGTMAHSRVDAAYQDRGVKWWWG